MQEKVALHRAMSHPLRFRILMILSEREASPNEIAEELGERLNNVAYHVREMSKAGIIALVGTDKRRGGTIHIYKKVVESLLDTADAEALTSLERQVVSNEIIQKIVSDIAESVAAGKMDSHPARSLLRNLLTVDDEGMRKTGDLSLKFLADLEAVEVESLERLSESGEQGMKITIAALVFERAPNGGTKPPDRLI
jgi:DNA-binding transcriptional ArsR family regulator